MSLAARQNIESTSTPLLLLALEHADGWHSWVTAPTVSRAARGVGFSLSPNALRRRLSALPRFVEYRTKDRGRLFHLKPAASEPIEEYKSGMFDDEEHTVRSQKELHGSSATVTRALKDCEVLIRTQGATSGVDRIHTALHGYLATLCDAAGITVSEDTSIASMAKALREKHPLFLATGPRAEDITKLWRAIGVIADCLLPVRNKASIAHPNSTLLEEPEAMLVINTVRAIIQYLDDKVSDAHTTRTIVT